MMKSRVSLDKKRANHEESITQMNAALRTWLAQPDRRINSQKQFLKPDETGVETRDRGNHNLFQKIGALKNAQLT